MKKLTAILMALCLLLTACALAEADETSTIEIEPSYEGNYVAIGETGLCFLLPGDWQPVEAPEGVTGEVYSNPDGQIALTVTTGEGDLNALLDQYAELVNNGTLSECNLVNINGLDWLLSTTADNLQNYAQCQLDDTTILTFAFVVADPSIECQIAPEMIGTLASAE